jgi:hypothetical protein
VARRSGGGFTIAAGDKVLENGYVTYLAGALNGG